MNPSIVAFSSSAFLKIVVMPFAPTLRHCLAAVLVLFVLFFATPASAGSVYFGLSREGDKLVLVNHGDSTAFHPVVMRLLGDGRWEELPLAPGSRRPVELIASARLDFHWPQSSSAAGRFEAATPLMVRFFDQAGAGFGQISFFNQPPPTATPVQAEYVDGWLTLARSGDPAPQTGVSWLLWPQEEGIEPLSAPVRFEHVQPPAKRIEWPVGREKIRFDLGAGLPAAILLNETGAGLELQMLPNGGSQGRQQRAGWLRASFSLYRLGLLALFAAAVVMLAHWLRIRKEKAGV